MLTFTPAWHPEDNRVIYQMGYIPFSVFELFNNLALTSPYIDLVFLAFGLLRNDDFGLFREALFSAQINGHLGRGTRFNRTEQQICRQAD